MLQSSFDAIISSNENNCKRFNIMWTTKKENPRGFSFLLPFQYRRLFPAEQFLDGIHAGACNVLVDGAGAGFVVEGTLVGVCVDIPLV